MRPFYALDGPAVNYAQGKKQMIMKKFILVLVTAAVSYIAIAEGGFTVTQYNLRQSIGSVVAAKSAIQNSSSWRGSPVVKQYSRIAFQHGLPPVTTAPHFQKSMTMFPVGVPGGSVGGMVLEIYGITYIPSAGKWTFACGSDDGFEMKISGNGISESFSYTGERALDTTFKTISIPAAGEYAIEIIYFDNYYSVEYDAAVLEVSIAEGQHTAFSSVFKLLRSSSSIDILHDVIFNDNGGTGRMEPQEFGNGKEQKLSKNTYTKDGYVFQGWAETKADADNGIVKFRDEAEITVDHDMTLYAVWAAVSAKTEVVIHFKKDEWEFLEPNCDRAYWLCRDQGGKTPFAIMSGEAWPMPVGVYTIEFYSGETAFADPEPMQIVVDGTERRIEREVVLARKEVQFTCLFRNDQSIREYAMLNGMDPDSCCEWRLGSGEWHKNGASESIHTGSYTLSIRVDDRIRLMVGMDIIGLAVTLDGTETSHTETIDVLGQKCAKVTFGFRGHVAYPTEFYPPASDRFDKSKVEIALSSLRGEMILHNGEYYLPQGGYRASFRYCHSEGSAVYWYAPYDMTFRVDGIDKTFVLNFTDTSPSDNRVNIWFDANRGIVDTPLLSYAIHPVHVTSILSPEPRPTRDGYEFCGWYTKKKGGKRVSGFVPKPDDPDIEYTQVSGEDSCINGKHAIHLYAHWTDMTPSWISQFLSVFTASSGDIATAASMTAANGCRTVGECYSLGIDPEDPDDDLKIVDFKMADGKPVITLNHTEDGSGNSFLPRVKTLGKATLSDAEEWREVPEEGDETMRFFKVEVEMP